MRIQAEHPAATNHTETARIGASTHADGPRTIVIPTKLLFAATANFVPSRNDAERVKSSAYAPKTRPDVAKVKSYICGKDQQEEIFLDIQEVKDEKFGFFL